MNCWDNLKSLDQPKKEELLNGFGEDDIILFSNMPKLDEFIEETKGLGHRDFVTAVKVVLKDARQQIGRQEAAILRQAEREEDAKRTPFERFSRNSKSAVKALAAGLGFVVACKTHSPALGVGGGFAAYGGMRCMILAAVEVTRGGSQNAARPQSEAVKSSQCENKWPQA